MTALASFVIFMDRQHAMTIAGVLVYQGGIARLKTYKRRVFRGLFSGALLLKSATPTLMSTSAFPSMDFISYPYANAALLRGSCGSHQAP